MADELENEVTTEEERLPYPEGTAPPVLDDAVHATAQPTLTEAIVQALYDSHQFTSTQIALYRSLTATEVLSLVRKKPYSSLSEAVAGLVSALYPEASEDEDSPGE